MHRTILNARLTNVRLNAIQKKITVDIVAKSFALLEREVTAYVLFPLPLPLLPLPESCFLQEHCSRPLNSTGDGKSEGGNVKETRSVWWGTIDVVLSWPVNTNIQLHATKERIVDAFLRTSLPVCDAAELSWYVVAGGWSGETLSPADWTQPCRGRIHRCSSLWPRLCFCSLSFCCALSTSLPQVASISTSTLHSNAARSMHVINFCSREAERNKRQHTCTEVSTYIALQQWTKRSDATWKRPPTKINLFTLCVP